MASAMTSSKRRNMDMMKLMMSDFDVKMSEGANASDFCVSSECSDLSDLMFDHIAQVKFCGPKESMWGRRKYLIHASF